MILTLIRRQSDEQDLGGVPPPPPVRASIKERLANWVVAEVSAVVMALRSGAKAAAAAFCWARSGFSGAAWVVASIYRSALD